MLNNKKALIILLAVSILTNIYLFKENRHLNLETARQFNHKFGEYLSYLSLYAMQIREAVQSDEANLEWINLYV